MIGVTIPQTEGRRISAWLSPQDGEVDHEESQQLSDLKQRLLRVGAANFLMQAKSPTPADVEFVELYQPTKIGSIRGSPNIFGRRTNTATSISMQPPTLVSCGNVSMPVWLRN